MVSIVQETPNAGFAALRSPMVSIVQETPNAPCSWEETGGVEKLTIPTHVAAVRAGLPCRLGTYHTFGALSLYSQLYMSSPT